MLQHVVVSLIRASVAGLRTQSNYFERFLSQDEWRRAARYRIEADRLRSRLAWGLVRLFVGRIQDVPPGSLMFERSLGGKPHLNHGPSFNLSHSGDHILIGVADGGQLGVDIEVLRRIRDLLGLSRLVLSDAERAELQAYPRQEQMRAFFRAWTRKEALVKASGDGLAMPLKTFSVSLSSEVKDALKSISWPAATGTRWCVRALPELPDASQAIASDRAIGRVQWTDVASLMGR